MRILSFALIFAGNMAAAQEIEFQQFLEVEWETSATQETQLANEISDLYVTLYNTGNLPTQSVTLGEFATPLEAFAATGAYFTARVLPSALDGLLCDLNPDHCSRARQSVNQNTLDAYNSHVGGYAATTTRWTAGPDATIVVPFLEFEQTTRLDRQQQPKGWTPNNYVASPNTDCSQWATTCEEIVERFNPYTLALPNGSVEATVPTPTLSATLRLRADNMAQVAGALSDAFEILPSDAEVRAYIDPLPRASVEWQRALDSQSQLDMAIQGLSKDLSVMGTIKEFSNHETDPFFEKQTELFTLIRHPFGQGIELSGAHQAPVGVVVIDEKVEKRHCDWPKVLFPDGSEMPADDTGAHIAMAESTEQTAPDGTLPCTEIFETAFSSADHATHVAGIIAAQKNGIGIVGVNPYAQLSFIHYDRRLPANRQLTDLQIKMITHMPPEARVANMSGGLDRRVGSASRIQDVFENYKTFVLFVVAAGNDGLHMDGVQFDCDEYPACLHGLDNVITVVGINRNDEDPAPWTDGGEASNTSPNFNISAVAEDVFSTVSANRYGHKSGTSQAAPQVAAAASIVFSAGEATFASKPITPKIVKDRLVYTADLVPELLDDVRGGARLNVERAIDVANARFELFDGQIIIGQIEKDVEDYQCTTADDNERNRSFWATRRIVWNEVSQKHVIYHNSVTDPADRGNRFTSLERFSSCTLATRSAEIWVRVRKGAEDEGDLVKFKFSEIRDYTSRLFD